MSLIMKNLTDRQKEILDLIKSYVGDYGFPPTRADISKELGFKSANAAEQHLRAIEKKGYIKILSGASRGIVLNKEEEQGIPVIGLVAAGGPILAQENIEKRIPDSQSLLSENIDSRSGYQSCTSQLRRSLRIPDSTMRLRSLRKAIHAQEILSKFITRNTL